MYLRSTVVERTFISYEMDKDNPNDMPQLIFSRPGFVSGETYFPAESVTIFGETALDELINFLVDVKRDLTLTPERIENASVDTTESTEPTPTTDLEPEYL